MIAVTATRVTRMRDVAIVGCTVHNVYSKQEQFSAPTLELLIPGPALVRCLVPVLARASNESFRRLREILQSWRRPLLSSTNLAIPQTVVQDPEVHNTRGDLLGPLQPAKVLRIRACLRLTPGPGPPRGRECEVCVAFT